jgi:hypothetical protein
MISAELVARGFTKFLPSLFDIQCALMRQCVDFTGKTTLEVGARDGRHSEAALAMGAAEATALELRPEPSSQIVRTRPVQFVYGDCRTVDLAQTFDIVMAYGILYHVPDPGALIARLSSWAREWLFISTHCGQSAEVVSGGYGGQWLGEGVADIDAAEPTPSLWLARSELRRAISDHGGRLMHEMDYDVGGIPAVWVAVRMGDQ